MNHLIHFTPAVLGALVVLQAGLNRKIAAQWGLPVATVLNATVLAIGAFALLALSLSRSSALGTELTSHFDPKLARLWFVAPGLIGLCLVFGGPWAVARWGAVHTFVFLVSGQLLASLFWDWKVEGLPISKERLLGIALAWAGAWIATRGR